MLASFVWVVRPKIDWTLDIRMDQPLSLQDLGINTTTKVAVDVERRYKLWGKLAL